MTDNKKIVVSLPKSLVDEFDEELHLKSGKNRSQFIKEAVILYIKEHKQMNMRELMKKGYEDMAEINANIAEFGIASDCVELSEYEAGLAESDSVDGTGGEKRRYILC